MRKQQIVSKETANERRREVLECNASVCFFCIAASRLGVIPQAKSENRDWVLVLHKHNWQCMKMSPSRRDRGGGKQHEA